MEVNYGQQEGETTANWLRRLIAVNAPQDVRADVRQILAGEQQGKSMKLCDCTVIGVNTALLDAEIDRIVAEKVKKYKTESEYSVSPQMQGNYIIYILHFLYCFIC